MVLDPVKAAQQAGLRWMCDDVPGIRRVRAGKGFRYVGADGKAVRDAATLARIRKLVIPPAWRDVWICPSPDGHVQATGRDARGRKQYRYHDQWRQKRDETKYDKMLLFGLALPKIRARVDEDLALPGLPRDKVLATVVRLLETTLIRVGNEEYARANGSFGLTTLRSRHVDVAGSTIRFHFRGKSGKRHRVAVHDRRLARIIRRCQDLPGHELFQYVDDDGALHPIDSQDVNDYLKEITHQDITAKDFRTWNGTVLAAAALREALRSGPRGRSKRGDRRLPRRQPRRRPRPRRRSRRRRAEMAAHAILMRSCSPDWSSRPAPRSSSRATGACTARAPATRRWRTPRRW